MPYSQNIRYMWSSDDITPTEEIVLGFIPLDLYRKLAKLAGRIDFGCKFHNGICQGYNKKWAEHDQMNRSKIGCCCASCVGYTGYWDEYPNIDDKQFDAMDKTFNKKTGFWRPGGCLLPIELKSPTCLAYNCCDDNFGKAEILLIKTLRLGIVYYQEKDIKRVVSDVNKIAEELDVIKGETPMREALEKVIDYCDRMIPERSNV